jgi:uncharacterized protein YkwD
MRWVWGLVGTAALLGGCKGDPVTPFQGNPDASTDTDADTDVDAGDPAEACDPSAADWPTDWAAAEASLLEMVNGARAGGIDCGDAGVFEAAPPLAMEPRLQCAARVHSLDMGTRNYFGHDSPGGPLGDNQWERVQNAGYEGILLDENIGAGQDAAATFEMWVGSGEHCAKLMDPDASETGIGYASVEGSAWTKYWTQLFGAP